MEITVYDDDGNPVSRTYGTVERPPYVPAPGLDPERFGWDLDIDTVTIGELPGFTVTGILGGEPHVVQWRDGEFVQDTAGEAKRLIAEQTEVMGSPTGPFFLAAVQPAHVALLTAFAAFDKVSSVTGEVPEIPGMEIPEGFVA